MWFYLYQILLAASVLVLAPLVLVVRHRHYASSLRARLGLEPAHADGQSRLWIHAVSVGEVGVAATLATGLPDVPLLITTVTPSGQERAQHHFSRAVVTYLPFDLTFLVRRFCREYHPAFLVLCEGDLWPAVLRVAADDRIPVAVVNGRISTKSYRRMRRIKRLLGPLLDPVQWFAVQTEIDRRRLEALGVPPAKISVTGNLKFETPEPAHDQQLEELVQSLATGRPILVAGSTMAGEEELVLEAFRAAGGSAAGFLVIAPRHPERWDAVGELLEKSGLSWQRRSAAPSAPGSRLAVLLLDSLGELADLYRHAAAAFIGGTLVPTGGHNPLEAARFGVPVIVGPSMENFQEIEAAFDADSAWLRVDGSAGLAVGWRRLIADPDLAAATGRRGRAVVERHRGALAETVDGLLARFDLNRLQS